MRTLFFVALLSILLGLAVFFSRSKPPTPSKNTAPNEDVSGTQKIPEENPPLVESLQARMGDLKNTKDLDDLFIKGADPNAVDKSGRPALSLAVRNNDLPAMELLLSKGADANKRDKELEWTPLMTATYLAARDTKFLPALELLLTKGADPNAEQQGATALHIAVNNIPVDAKSARVIETLLRAGAKPDGVPALNGKQPPLPIHLAARSGKGAAALALAEGGATLGAAGSVAQSAAEIARSSHFPELASILEKIEKKKKPKAAATPKAAPSKKRH